MNQKCKKTTVVHLSVLFLCECNASWIPLCRIQDSPRPSSLLTSVEGLGIPRIILKMFEESLEGLIEFTESYYIHICGLLQWKDTNSNLPKGRGTWYRVQESFPGWAFRYSLPVDLRTVLTSPSNFVWQHVWHIANRSEPWCLVY